MMQNLRFYIRQILTEIFEIGILPKDIFKLINYADSFKDLYPGYNSDFENEFAENYFFPSKEKAYEEVEDILLNLKTLPNPIPVYRTIRVNNLEDINYDYLGDSWSYNKDSALSFAKNHNKGNVLLSAKVPKQAVDWKETIKNYFLFSHSLDESNEDEIKINNIESLSDIKVEFIKNIVNENSDKFKLNRYVYHASNINNRKIIDKHGIIPYKGVQWLEDTPIKGIAVFATNSDNQKHWFDSTWDDDVWKIDTTKIPNIRWFIDPNATGLKNKYWIYTTQLIPRNAIELIKRGTGADLIDK